MDIEKITNSLTLKEKIAQMFIMGFSGTELDENNINIQNMAKNSLGGIIYFAENINSYDQTAKLTRRLQDLAKIPLFVSIDQEGGLVERTINVAPKIDYLPPMALCSSNNPENTRIHTAIMAQELKSIGINMNFAPVLDVNTNENNPIIGVRSFSKDTDDVIRFSESVYNTLKENNIIPVGKHFPGHGEAWVDSHLDLPQINLNLDKLENIHIRPFKAAIDNGLDAVMVAHAHYSAFNNHKIPASLSKEVIDDYLIKKLNFNGLIISDDMVMGGIINHFSQVDACIRAINAGIDILIFRYSNNEDLKLVDYLADAVQNGLISEERITESVKKILSYKLKYNILNNSPSSGILSRQTIEENQNLIDKIAVETIKVHKKGNLTPFDKYDKILILSPDKSQIFNYSKDRVLLSNILNLDNCKEIIYPLNPSREEIDEIKSELRSYDMVVFVSYNAVLNKGQLELFNVINNPIIGVAAGLPYDADYFNKADSIFLIYSLRSSSLRALKEFFIKNARI